MDFSQYHQFFFSTQPCEKEVCMIVLNAYLKINNKKTSSSHDQTVATTDLLI